MTGANTTEFALAAFVETHDPVPGARDTLEGALAPGGDAAVDKRESLGEAIGDGGE